MSDLTLASGSQTRIRLLAQAGLTFKVASPGIDEDAIKQNRLALGEAPAAVAAALARAKALSVSRHAEGLVIGADQTLELDGMLFSKPRDAAELRDQLNALRGRSHRLHAAAAVAQGDAVLWAETETVILTVRDFSPWFLDRYLDRNAAAVLDCVGGYQFEGEGVQLFDRVEGDYFAILGLPLLSLLAFLRAQGQVHA